MGDVYDNPQDTYAEQSARLPRGPLRILEPPEVQVDEEFPPEALMALREFLAGRLGVMELALRLEALQRKSQEPVLRPWERVMDPISRPQTSLTDQRL